MTSAPAAATASFTYTIAGQTTAPTTTLPGSEITIVGGPNATANIPGSRNDPADFYGIVLVIIGIAVAIILTRLIFGRTGRQEEEQPR